jgi:hypothetical protein
MNINDLIRCAVIALAVVTFCLPFVILAGYWNPVIGSIWHTSAVIELIYYVFVELPRSQMDDESHKAKAKCKKKEKKKESRILSPFEFYILRILMPAFEKKAEWVISMQLEAAWRESSEIFYYSPLVPILCSAASIMFAILSKVILLSEGIWLAMFFVLLYSCILIRDAFEDPKRSFFRMQRKFYGRFI